MYSPKVEKSLMTGEWTDESFAEWDADDDPIVAEVRAPARRISPSMGSTRTATAPHSRSSATPAETNTSQMIGATLTGHAKPSCLRI